MFIKTLLAVVVVAAVIVSDGGVTAKSMMRAKKMSADEKEAYCAMKMMSCLIPIMQFAGKSEDELREEVLQDGLTGICTPLTSFSDCFSEAVQECEVPLTAEQQEGLNMITKITNFICKENLQAINADRRCLFGDALDQATNTQCGQPNLDEVAVCQMSTHINCAAGVYENVCSNPSLAAKFRSFGHQLEQDAGCYRALKVRKLFNDLVARF